MTTPMTDPYTVLGIARAADDRQLRDAYRRLAKRYHPDLHPGGQTSQRMQRFNEAWDVLSDPVRRARYDSEHRSGSPATGRPWPPAWTPTTDRTTRRSPAAGWETSSWSSVRGATARPLVEQTRPGGPPWAAILVVLAIGWLVLGGIVGGFPLPLIIGF